LRAIAPKEVKTKDIYLGAFPWIALQLVLVATLIVWPESVTYWIGGHDVLDQESVDKALEGLTVPDMGIGTPDFGQPPELDLK